MMGFQVNHNEQQTYQKARQIKICLHCRSIGKIFFYQNSNIHIYFVRTGFSFLIFLSLQLGEITIRIAASLMRGISYGYKSVRAHDFD